MLRADHRRTEIPTFSRTCHRGICVKYCNAWNTVLKECLLKIRKNRITGKECVVYGLRAKMRIPRRALDTEWRCDSVKHNMLKCSACVNSERCSRKREKCRFPKTTTTAEEKHEFITAKMTENKGHGFVFA